MIMTMKCLMFNDYDDEMCKVQLLKKKTLSSLYECCTHCCQQWWLEWILSLVNLSLLEQINKDGKARKFYQAHRQSNHWHCFPHQVHSHLHLPVPNANGAFGGLGALAVGAVDQGDSEGGFHIFHLHKHFPIHLIIDPPSIFWPMLDHLNLTTPPHQVSCVDKAQPPNVPVPGWPRGDGRVLRPPLPHHHTLPHHHHHHPPAQLEGGDQWPWRQCDCQLPARINRNYSGQACPPRWLWEHTPCRVRWEIITLTFQSFWVKPKKTSQAPFSLLATIVS